MRILIIDSINPVFAAKLTDAGHEVIDGCAWSQQQVTDSINQYDGICIRSRFTIDQTFLDTAQRLKFIARAGAGMENIDLHYAASKGIACINSPEGNRDAVGEHATGMLLMLLNRLAIANEEVRNGTWLRAENRGRELKGLTVAIIGFGNMGSTFAKKLSGFECEILAYDPYIEISKTLFPFVKQVEMPEIFHRADILSLHVPLNAETLFLVDEGYLQKFRKEIIVINTARGKNMRLSDLVKNIKSGKVAGACLDVFEFESSSFENIDTGHLKDDWQYLIHSQKVILTPHIAGWTHDSNYKMAAILAEKILAL